MSAECRWLTGGAVVFCGLAVVNGLGPVGEMVATSTALGLLGALGVGCLLGYRRYVLRIREEIEKREARGVSLLKRDEAPVRGPVCPARARGPQRMPVIRCGPGRRRYR